MTSSQPIRRSTPVAMLALASILVASPIVAQESTTRGLSLGAHLSAATLAVEDDDRSEAAGGGIRIGYGFNRIVTIFAQIDGAKFDVDPDGQLAGDWAMAHVDLGARFHFANSLRWWVPYLEAAFTARAVEVSDAEIGGETAEDVSFSGGAFTVGGGLMAYVTETLALDVNLAFSGGEFSEVNVGAVSFGALDLDASSSRLGIGMVWWP